MDISQFVNDAKIKPIDLRDYRLENCPAGAVVLPSKFSLRDKIGKIKNQGTSSSCVAQATAYYVQLLNFIETQTQVEMSARDIYSLIYQPGGGAYIADAMKKVCGNGVVPEANAVSYQQGQPPTEAFMESHDNIDESLGTPYVAKSYVTWDNTNINSYKQAIVQGNGFVSVTWGNNACWQTANVLVPDLPSQMVWRHGLFFTGYDDTTQKLEFVNSWNGWGDLGFGYLPYDYVTKGYLVNPVTLVDAPNTYWFSLLNIIANLKLAIAKLLSSKGK